ncbi:MAG TPA: M24 family metallopeptidase [Candidatus Polarisedimenticolia bacterium]|nr:M24 family metallopeptidase [Candidatus Polarisedimenticolia bacterium]
MRKSRRDFLVGSMAAVAGGVVAPAWAARDNRGGAVAPQTGSPASNGGDSAALLKSDSDHPPAATFDRLDEVWHKRAIQRLQGRMREEGIDGALLGDRWNIIYFTGLWHTSTERPFHIFVPGEGLDLTWFHPGLDRDLVGSWWIKDRETYFDFKHGEGAFPNLGKVQMGATVDLTRWMLKGLKKRGWAGRTIGVDGPITADLASAVEDVLPKTSLKKAGDLCDRLRMVKTAEEIALTQRAMNYFSRIHAFARDYILTHGTDKTDFDVQTAATQYGVDLIMKDIKRDGRPHTAVGISVDLGVRTGVGTAYPHPNQFHHNRIKTGDALQVSGGVKIGGYGGELYRAYQIAPFDSLREKVWEVHTECCRIQAEASTAGVTGSYVAKQVHDYQVKNGMAPYVYHRPAHGEGSEGHQPPYISLGDHTMLEKGMTFSNEPGLYVPEHGFGYNHSDNVLVTERRGVHMGSVPFSKEWCFLKL